MSPIWTNLLQRRPVLHLDPTAEQKSAPAIGGEDRAFAVFEVGEHRVGRVGKVLFVRDKQHISFSGPWPQEGPSCPEKGAAARARDPRLSTPAIRSNGHRSWVRRGKEGARSPRPDNTRCNILREIGIRRRRIASPIWAASGTPFIGEHAMLLSALLPPFAGSLYVAPNIGSHMAHVDHIPASPQCLHKRMSKKQGDEADPWRNLRTLGDQASDKRRTKRQEGYA